MILSNTRIIKEIEKNNIFIGRNSSEAIPITELEFDTTTLNLHLANEFISWKEFKSGAKISVDPGRPNFKFQDYAHDFTESAIKDREGYYEIRKHEFLLCKTLEYIRLPKKFAGRVEGRSSLGRLGIAVHITAPTIHAAYEGTITLEVYNHSPIPVILRPGMKIGQMIFEEVDGIPTVSGDRTFAGQTTSIGKKTK